MGGPAKTHLCSCLSGRVTESSTGVGKRATAPKKQTKQLVAIKALLWFIVAVANKLMRGKHNIFSSVLDLTVVLLFLFNQKVPEFF